MKKQSNKKERLNVKSITIKISTNDFYDYDALIQTKAGIKKVVKDNPMLQRLLNGETAY